MIAKIYTKDNCSFCEKAKNLLTESNIDYEELNIADTKYLTELKLLIPDVKTVPQIYLNNIHIGGYSDLYNYIHKDD